MSGCAPCLRSASAHGQQNPLRWIKGRASSGLGHFDPIRAHGEYRLVIGAAGFAAGWLPLQAAKSGITWSVRLSLPMMVVRTVRMPKVDFLDDSQSSRGRTTLARDRPLHPRAQAIAEKRRR